MSATGRSGTIVAGVDGSPSSRAATAFALDEGRLRGVPVRLVAVWHVPAAAFAGGFAPPPEVAEDLEGAAQAALERTLGELDASGVHVESFVREGQPAQILLEEAAGAELLVVGSRGLGGFRGLLLGSVSAQCAHHAECPVVIVRAPET